MMAALDSHFRGFTPLHSCRDQECTFDIVAISGLGGHAFGSFKQRGKNFMWLRDALPDDIIGARIFIYGYDTRLQGSTSCQSITDIGSAFLTDIKAIRADEDCQRPLMLIGHSLGGLIVKQAIIQMSEGDDSDRSLLRSICGILFFGVPNRGMDIKSLIPMVGDQPNRYLLETLGRASEMLGLQAKRFRDSFASRGSEIISFYETLMSPTAEKKNGSWSMSGPDALLVDSASATYEGNWDSIGQTVYPVDTTHSDMVKFPSEHDKTYLAVVRQLKRLKGKKDDRKSHLQELSADQKACLRSLAITEQVRRIDQIAPAKDTCNWLLEHKSYLQWTSQPRGMLWIKGKPGAGKSSLMKYMLDVHGRLWVERGAIIASFFVYGQGDQMQRSTQGLFHSLLHQLYPIFPTFPALQALTYKFKLRNENIGRHGERWSWSPRELEDTLNSVLEQAPQSRPLVILVDALDELDAEAAIDVINSFQSILGRLEGSSSLRICFACRHYPTLTLDECLKIIVEKGNNEDIRTVVNRKLPNLPNAQSLVTSIVEKANGIFQWADLVTTRLRQQHLQGVPPAMLAKTVAAFPGDLYALYSTLLQDSPEDRTQTIRLLQWVCFAQQPLSVAELVHAVIVDTNIASNSIKEYRVVQGFGNSEQEVELRFRHLSKGLIEFSTKTYSKSLFNAVGHFIHQSVLDYLLSRGFNELDRSLGIQTVARGHLQLAKTCIHYFNLLEIEVAISEVLKETIKPNPPGAQKLILRPCPFSCYALRYWGKHGKLAEGLLDGPNAFLELFAWSMESAINTHEIRKCLRTSSTIERIFVTWALMYPFEYHNSDFCSWIDASTIVQFLAHEDMWRTISLLGQRKKLISGSSTGASTGSIPLLIAVKNGGFETVKTVMDFRDVDVNFQDRQLRTPLHHAASRGHYEILDLLLSRPEVDPDLRDYHGETPFMMAKTVEIARRLLDTGRIDPGARNRYGETALHIAAATKNLAVCRFLLSTRGILPDARNSMGQTPLAQSITAPAHGSTKHSEVLELFLATPGIDPNVEDVDGCTPLIRAICRGDVELMRLLLKDTRVNRGSRDKNGRSALSYAVNIGGAATVKLLLDAGRVCLDANNTGERRTIS